MSTLYKVDTLSLGDELLLGIRANAHLVYLGRELAQFGLPLRRALVLRDAPEEIRDGFLSCWKDADILITTGGLGPTDDDLTRETIAACLGRKLVHDMPSEVALRERFERFNRKPTANNLKQCYLIEGAEAIPNRFGTAPGQWLRDGQKVLIMLPGPVNELQPMWRDQVLPRLKIEGLAEEIPAYLQLRTHGIGESQLETNLKPIIDRYPGRLSVAYCAHMGAVDVRLSAYGHSLSWQELETIGSEMKAVLAEDFVDYGDRELPEIILNLLRANDRTLAVAESCTGGLLSSAFTDIPGASKVFMGGLVCYTNEIKEQVLDVPDCMIQQHGAVSGECAVAMAIGLAEKFGADYALSISGFAGPGGGTEANPVGTVHIGLSSPFGVWSHKIASPGNRLQVKERAVNGALDFLRRKLRKYEEKKEFVECLTLD
ncbi:MAG: competence/damage-inducible protein A [Verrucomicrobiota bacterium]|nr:competence/damage-inducible protein A [Verrucomicrobiota bacterium]